MLLEYISLLLLRRDDIRIFAKVLNNCSYFVGVFLGGNWKHSRDAAEGGCSCHHEEDMLIRLTDEELQSGTNIE